MKNNSTALIIGRWEILHRGHEESLLRTALAAAPRVLIVIGSAFHARDPRNPFTWSERREMFEAVLTREERARVTFLPIRDYYNDERWRAAVRKAVTENTPQGGEVLLVGFKKDYTSSYLNDFSEYRSIAVTPTVDIGSTDLRKIFFEAHSMPAALSVMRPYVSEGVLEYLRGWAHLPAYRDMVLQHKAVIDYRAKWTGDFYLTADSIVTSCEYLLLVRRGPEKEGDICIGDGNWALPGGFVGKHELILDAALRELAEETAFNPLRERMMRALRRQAVFDHPLRSLRGRLVTTVHHFELGDERRAEVHGRSDAREAGWFHFEELSAIEDQLFEDHGPIISDFLPVFQH